MRKTAIKGDKHMFKKILVLILVAALLQGTIAFAYETTIDYKNYEIQALKDNGIIVGDQNGDLRPDEELTRAEFATILCHAIGVDKLAESAEMIEKEYFSDVPSTHWAAGYINTAFEYKAINGFDDGTFRPENPVTNEQVVKMLVAAWGYGDEAEKLGGYPNGYMEVAKKYGLTDSVLFNYGIASKRWVACAFIYGAIALLPPSENVEIEIPVEIEETEIKVIEEKEPIPENTDYVNDPVSILKRVTPESARFERTWFMQNISPDLLPFDFEGDTLLFNEEQGNRKISAYVSERNKKEPFADGFFIEGKFDLSGLPIGTWECQLSIIDGAVKDTYFASIKKNYDGVFEFAGTGSAGYAVRTTDLNVQPLIAINERNLDLNYAQSAQMKPFLIKPIFDNNGKPTLSVSYEPVLEDDYRFFFSMNTMDESVELVHPPMRTGDKIYESNAYFEPIRGENKIIDPLVLYDLEFDTDYHIQMGVDSVYGGESLKGIIRILNKNGALSYIFKGSVHNYTIDGFEIKDYED